MRGKPPGIQQAEDTIAAEIERRQSERLGWRESGLTRILFVSQETSPAPTLAVRLSR